VPMGFSRLAEINGIPNRRRYHSDIISLRVSTVSFGQKQVLIKFKHSIYLYFTSTFHLSLALTWRILWELLMMIWV